MPSSMDLIPFELKSKRCRCLSPLNSLVEKIGFKVSPNKLWLSLNSVRVLCKVCSILSVNLRSELWDKSKLRRGKLEEKICSTFPALFFWFPLAESKKDYTWFGRDWCPEYLWENETTGAPYGIKAKSWGNTTRSQSINKEGPSRDSSVGSRAQEQGKRSSGDISWQGTKEKLYPVAVDTSRAISTPLKFNISVNIPKFKILHTNSFVIMFL